MVYASSTTYLLTRLQKKFSNSDPKEEWSHAGLYNYNGRQKEPCLIEDRLTGPRLIEDTLTGPLIHQNKQRFIINQFFSMLLINREFEWCFSLIRKQKVVQNETNVQGKLSNKTDICTAKYKHRTGRIFVQIK